MKTFISIAFTIAIILLNVKGYCQYANLDFIENKGQWDNSVKFKGDLNNGAFFLMEKGFRVLQNNGDDVQKLADYFHGTVHTSKNASNARAVVVPDDDKIILRSHVYDVTFLNAGKPVITPDKALASYNNYFLGNDQSKWKSNCRIFQAVTYKNIYEGVDVRYYTSEGKLKYDIVVHPGADASKIALRFDGVTGLDVKNDELIIKTSVGEVRELAPYAFQVINGLKTRVGCRFKVSGKTVIFNLDSYSKSSTLVIDPTLVFSTFSGSTADNWGYTATYGPDGSFFAGGVVFGAGFRTSPGAFQTVYAGGTSDEEGLPGYDIGIMKFDQDGINRLYATYIGGSGNEHPHSMVTDAQGNLVIGGRTNSANYPLKNGDTVGKGGNYDIILTKLNATGTDLIGSRKIGGTGYDGVNIRPKYASPTGVESLRRNYGDDSRSEVLLDNAGNILLASNTQSADFPITSNAFQTRLAGKQDGLLIKASPDLSTILVSSYLGGNENDAAFVLALNPSNGNIYVGGNTVSTNLPGDKSGVLYPAFQLGETDGFVSIISPDATTLLKTTYLGTQGNDMLYGIQFDKFGFPYVMGTTSGTTTTPAGFWPVVNAAYSQPGGKQFIAKLRPDLSAFEYSTVFGTNTIAPNISPIAFLVDRCENVYVSGWGGDVNNGNGSRSGYPNAGTRGLPVTADAIKATSDNSDFYFFVLERNATSQLYGSFFGQTGGGSGEHVDGGTSRFDRNGVIYQALCANCGRDVPFPTTPGVWSEANGSSRCNLAAVKIAFNLAGVTGSVRSSIQGSTGDTTGCVPLTVDFTDTIGAGKLYMWNFNDGSPEVTTTSPNVSHTFNSIGTYRVRLISIDSSKCNISDTAYTNIRVRTFKGELGFNTRKLPPCEALNYEFTNTSIVTPPAIPYTNTSFVWDFGDNTPRLVSGTAPVTHSFPGPGVYTIKLVLTDTNFCNAPDSIEQTLRIATNVKANFNTPVRGCAPYNAVFENTSAGGQQFFWDFGDNTTSTEVSPEHFYATPGTYVVKLKAIDSATCNIEDSTSLTIVVSGKPTASFVYSPNPPQENTPVNFVNTATGATGYLWQFGDGETLSTTSAATVAHTYNETGTFNACLIATNNFGCADTACQSINAIIIPLLDVPNAFTPNNDGINDKVFVRGFGITRMLWRIYNRWGALVFQTNDRTIGWDGTYNGIAQPNEVYHYVLDVQFANKTNYQKKGDITLLR